MQKHFVLLFAVAAIALKLAAMPIAASAVGPGLPLDPIRVIAQSPDWLKLLHYHRSFPGFSLRSQLAGPEFFLSPEGQTAPEAELRADIVAFADPTPHIGRLHQTAQCAFPVRYQLLKRLLKLTTADLPCPEYQEFLGRFNAHSVTLVFSSAYPGSPGSMFGHTFLRINAKQPEGGKKLDLLDYGISYAAHIPPHENSFAYAYLGLTGGYPGQFSMEPYYRKVREYNNTESRDLWEYDLSLTEDETVRLVSHAWEIETTSGFMYYFASQNCSYQLLALLEAIHPEWDLTGYFIHVVPAETIKKVAAIQGAVTAVHLRPALRKRVLVGYELLSSQDKSLVDQLISGQAEPASVQSAPPLDVAIEYEHYQKESNEGVLQAKDQKLLSQALLRRSQMPEAPRAIQEAIEARADTRPDTGHYPYRVGISGGVLSADSTQSAAQGFTDLNLKMAYHDLLNNDQGYSRFSQIDFPAITLRYRPADNRLSIEQLLIGEITSLNPYTLIDRKISWHARADYYAAKDFGCLDCHLLRGEAAVGPTFEVFTKDALLTAFLYGYFEGGQSLSDSVRGGPKVELALLVNPVAPYKSRMAVQATSDLLQPDRPWANFQFSWEHSLSLSPRYELRASLLRYFHGAQGAVQTSDYEEAKFALNLYF